MQRCVLKEKVHRATVTDADTDYEGSISIDARLMKGADIVPYERVQVWSMTSGERFETYTILAEEESGVVCINGTSALCIGKSEIVTIAAFTWMDDAKTAKHHPRIAFVDARNRFRDLPATPEARFLKDSDLREELL